MLSHHCTRLEKRYRPTLFIVSSRDRPTDLQDNVHKFWNAVKSIEKWKQMLPQIKTQTNYGYKGELVPTITNIHAWECGFYFDFLIITPVYWS